MGLVPIDWRDIYAWVSLTGTDINSEEARILHSLSIIYVSQHNRSKKEDCPAPFREEETSDCRSANIKAGMAKFKNRSFSK